MASRQCSFFFAIFAFILMQSGNARPVTPPYERRLLEKTSGSQPPVVGVARTGLDAGRSTCNAPTSFRCDCEDVPRETYFRVKQTFAGEKLDCVPVCDDRPLPVCTVECDSVVCIGAMGLYSEFCGTSMDRVIADAIRAMKCKYDKFLMMQVCTREDKELVVDRQTYDSVSRGFCVSGCGVKTKNLKCSFEPRYYGEPFIPTDPPLEPPVAPPSEAPEAPPDIEPEEPPVDPPDYEFYEIPDAAPSEPPELLEEYDFDFEFRPVPEPEVIDEEILEYMPPPDEPPEVAPQIVRIDIPIEQTVELGGDNSFYFSSWSDCTQYCSQTGPRIQRRSVICRNRFGVPLPMSECDGFDQPDVIRECPFAKCLGDYYYVLGDWSECSQQCSSYDPKTGRMSVGLREKELTCLFLNGTLTDRENCMELIQASEVDLVSICGSQPCRPVYYTHEKWGNCACETRSRIRKIVCMDFDGNAVDHSVCDALNIPKPRSAEYCIPQSC